ncbi:hypothetical protein OD754_12515 [Rhodobacter capsulatus]|uniref:hypothetical protein n=1 Tax=Rhodobacter capsulatus TaxID=1061 RepID=UPI0003056D3C|nr:hypothetical protein [Rhodobacter capsulatus]MDS0927642.1 hypothetical protein [Rhodobacter capsulatus]
MTGHTGFKGAWAARMLTLLGAEVTGLALDPAPGPSAFAALAVGQCWPNWSRAAFPFTRPPVPPAPRNPA